MRIIALLLAAQVDDSIVWAGSYDAALREARESGHPILLYVRDDDP